MTSRKLPVIIASMAQNPPSLGARIRRARERAQLSQEELAKAVGASVRAVGDWENNRRKPRNRLGAIEDVLGVRLDDEPEETEKPTPEEVADLRSHIRELLGEGSAVEAALDADLHGGPSPTGGGRNAGAAAASSSRRRALPRTG